MSSQAPTRSIETVSHSFSPKEITSPTKNFPGISKIVFTHVSNLHGLLNDWQKIQQKGTKICKTISALKLHECIDSYFPSQLQPLTESLLDAMESLKNIVEGVEIVTKQLQALAKLQPTDQAVILTWSASRISDHVNTVHNSLQKEYRLKQVITENIAHCRDENLIEVYVSSWEFEGYLDFDSNAYLFAEVGIT